VLQDQDAVRVSIAEPLHVANGSLLYLSLQARPRSSRHFV
jgi:hypothetical protein